MTVLVEQPTAVLPTVDDFASDPLVHRFGDLWNPPGLTNFLGCAQVDLDPVAVRSVSFPPYAMGEAVTGTLFLDDRLFSALGVPVTTTWRPDRVVREAAWEGLQVRTTTVVPLGRMAVVVRLEITNTGDRDLRPMSREATYDPLAAQQAGHKSPVAVVRGASMGLASGGNHDCRGGPMARTPLADLVSSAWRRADAEMQEEAVGPSRRDVLRRGGLVAAGTVAASALPGWRPAANAATAPRIAVVGAGLAGLSAAYQLKKAGYTAQVYEASTRIGGRCWSYNHGEFADGQVSEHGGELIDQNHTQIRQLVQELGLNLDNLLAAEPNGTESLNYFFGKPYTYTQATDDLKGIWQQIHSDVSAAGYPTLYSSYTQRGWELDHMSIYQWIDNYVPGGHSSPLGQLLDVAYNIEYGGETSVQSSLNMLYLLGYSGQGQMRIFGPSNEKSHVTGGNDLIVTGLANALAGQITTGVSLTALARNTDGTYKLSWSNGRTTTVDRVVLALPFSLLRAVDCSKAGFNAVKSLAIKSLSMGTNSKLHVQLTRRSWYDQLCNGETYADTGYQNTWEVTRAQAGASGILVNYTGGTIGASFGPKNGTPAVRAKKFFSQVDPVLPGLGQQWNGKAYIDYWAGNPWALGSYSFWKVGEYTSFVGAEREASSACHFAGEHTSIDFQGYLNGAVESGYRAANEIVAAYK